MFGSLMGDGFDDLFGSHMRRMNNMMSSFLGNPSNALMPFEDHSQNMFSPFGFPNMNHLMQNMTQMPNNPNCHSFSSSSVMTMTTGPDGKPQVYQASSSTRNGPGGIRETKKSICDSRTGVKKMSIGHHIGEKGHIKEKEQNMFNGQLEENDEYINLDEEEEPEFNKEWRMRTQQFQQNRPSIAYRQSSYGNNDNEYLALPPASRHSKYSNNRHHIRNSNNNYVLPYCLKFRDLKIKALPSSYSYSSTNHVKKDESQKKKSHRTKPYSKRKEKRNE